jgi:hypothetical protein
MVWAPGWGTNVELGSGQARLLEILRAVAARNPHQDWHELPPLRELGWSPSTAHRLIHRLAALGLTGIQVRRGCQGGIRFTLRPRRWKWTAPVRRAVTAVRIRVSAAARAAARAIVAPVQVAFAHTEPEHPPPPRILARHDVAPTRYEACARCGVTGEVRMGVYQAAGRYEYGLRCIDHGPCDERAGAR